MNINENLTKAINENNFEKVKLLIHRGADVNYIDEKQQTPLLCCIGNYNIEMLAFLLEKDANVNPNIKEVYTNPLHLAIDMSFNKTQNTLSLIEDDMSEIKILLKYGADIFSVDENNETAYEFAKDYHISVQKLFESII